MSNITVCARFRPLNPKEKQNDHDSFCIRCIDTETFIFKFLALPLIRDAVDAINGTIITYGQTGAGKTYGMEGSGIFECDEQKKGLLPRVVKGLFDFLNSLDEEKTYSIKLSMITVLDPAEALQNLSRGIANRAVGETKMNAASSRSHCIYVFTIQQEFSRDNKGHASSKICGTTYASFLNTETLNRMRSVKLILVDLAQSEKVEKTGAEGRVLEEAKAINKSLSALGNVTNSLTCGLRGKASHIPYRDHTHCSPNRYPKRGISYSHGGNARTALLCCCSPRAFNASESLFTLRFGSRYPDFL
ncbi:Kinesin-like protein KIN-1 [Glycine soja]|uniref:Kinesin-like protein KIN-1 n=1 Tax=Glycine soja TaxID=3848 RepID=A0A445LGG0_GLYSO|nr:Kinesin-like protein KIN-1 [Glycine soja]